MPVTNYDGYPYLLLRLTLQEASLCPLMAQYIVPSSTAGGRLFLKAQSRLWLCGVCRYSTAAYSLTCKRARGFAGM